jgi:hypothetical protein
LAPLRADIVKSAEALAQFGRHPVTVPMSKEEASGFSHV